MGSFLPTRQYLHPGVIRMNSRRIFVIFQANERKSTLGSQHYLKQLFILFYFFFKENGCADLPRSMKIHACDQENISVKFQVEKVQQCPDRHHNLRSAVFGRTPCDSLTVSKFLPVKHTFTQKLIDILFYILEVLYSLFNLRYTPISEENIHDPREKKYFIAGEIWQDLHARTGVLRKNTVSTSGSCQISPDYIRVFEKNYSQIFLKTSNILEYIANKIV